MKIEISIESQIIEIFEIEIRKYLRSINNVISNGNHVDNLISLIPIICVYPQVIKNHKKTEMWRAREENIC